MQLSGTSLKFLFLLSTLCNLMVGLGNIGSKLKAVSNFFGLIYQLPSNNIFLKNCVKSIKGQYVFLYFCFSICILIHFSDSPNLLENKLINKLSSPSSVRVIYLESPEAVLLPEMLQSPGKCWVDTVTLWVISILISCVGHSHLLTLGGYETVASFHNL